MSYLEGIPDKAIRRFDKSPSKEATYRQIATSTLLSYGIFPQTTEGIEEAKRFIASQDEMLLPSELPNYYEGIDSDLLTGKETAGIINIRETLKEFYGFSNAIVDTREGNVSVYKPEDKFVDDKKEFADDTMRSFEDALEEKSDEIMAPVDALIQADKERFERFKAEEAERVKQRIAELNKPEPEQPKKFKEGSFEFKLPPAHYIQGQAGRWEIEFESDVDHAIYFSGKPVAGTGKERSAKQKEALEWLKSLGISYGDILDHRKKILQAIRDTIAVPGTQEQYPYLYIDSVDKDFDMEDPEEEPEGLDDLLNIINDEGEEPEEDEQEVPGELDALLAEVKQEAEKEQVSDDQSKEVDDILADMPSSIQEELADLINKRKKEEPKKKGYTTNTQLLKSITQTMAAVSGQLEQVNKSLVEQNELLQKNIDINLASLEALKMQDDILVSKFDALMQAFNAQSAAQDEARENLEDMKSESDLENQRKAAGYEDPEDLRGTKKGGGRLGRITRFFRNKLLRKLYRKSPKALRRMRQRVRRVQRLPRRLRTRATNSIMRRLPNSAQRIAMSSGARGGATRALRGLRSARIPGLNVALSAWEYSERKKAGQTETQALVGTGAGLAGGLAGAAAGGKAGAAAGAAIGALFGGVGAIPGAAIGGAIGALLGGFAAGSLAAGAADMATGADKFETGTKPGTAMLHGTELVVDKDKLDDPFQQTAATILGATMQFVQALGPAGADVAPVINSEAAPLIKKFGMSNALASTTIGGSIPTVRFPTKDGLPRGERFEGMSSDDIEKLLPKNDTFDKLMRIFDPAGKFVGVLDSLGRALRNPFMPVENYDGTGVVGDLKGKIVNPMEGGELQDYPGAKFGAPRPGGRIHKGRDLIGPPGMQVVAAMPGKVTQMYPVGYLPSGGMSQGIVIEHANNMVTKYLHVDPGVQVGDEVKAGQKIATITDTDDISSAPHLHFELLVNGVHVDPDAPGQSILKNAHTLEEIQSGSVAGLSLEPDAALEAYTEAPGQTTTTEEIETPTMSETDRRRAARRSTRPSKPTTAPTPAVTAPVQKDMRIEMINMEGDEEEQSLIIYNMPAPPPQAAQMGIELTPTGDGTTYYTANKEYDVKLLEKLRLALQ